MKTSAILIALILSGCDHISQRIWNCSTSAIDVTKVLSNGVRVNDQIPARSYIASMEGGEQILALEKRVSGRSEVIWTEDRGTSVNEPTADPCRDQTSGLIGQQF